MSNVERTDKERFDWLEKHPDFRQALNTGKSFREQIDEEMAKPELVSVEVEGIIRIPFKRHTLNPAEDGTWKARSTHSSIHYVVNRGSANIEEAEIWEIVAVALANIALDKAISIKLRKKLVEETLKLFRAVESTWPKDEEIRVVDGTTKSGSLVE